MDPLITNDEPITCEYVPTKDISIDMDEFVEDVETTFSCTLPNAASLKMSDLEIDFDLMSTLNSSPLNYCGAWKRDPYRQNGFSFTPTSTITNYFSASTYSRFSPGYNVAGGDDFSSYLQPYYPNNFETVLNYRQRGSTLLLINKNYDFINIVLAYEEYRYPIIVSRQMAVTELDNVCMEEFSLNRTPDLYVIDCNKEYIPLNKKYVPLQYYNIDSEDIIVVFPPNT